MSGQTANADAYFVIAFKQANSLTNLLSRIP